ncbi:MAG: LysM peptidoglycan-binding domain-containing protein [Chthoniobacterales bacterium]
MKPIAFRLSTIFFAALFSASISAQTFASGTGAQANAQLETLSKKVDEQNAKIDALSQQILKLEQQISNLRPGVMIGESTPSAATPAAVATPAPAAAAGNSHVVTKGETLTSIAKANKVGVQELQKFNRIENDRALQIGQTIMIPTPGASPATSATVSPNE